MDNDKVAFGCVVLIAISIGLIVLLLSSMDDPTKCKECDPLPLWISSNSSIIEINQSEKKAYILIATKSRAIFFDFHYENKEIYWVEEEEDEEEVGTFSKIYKTGLQNENTTEEVGGRVRKDKEPRPLVEMGACGGLALDWIHSHMYWIHRDTGVIVEATLDGGLRRDVYHEADSDIYNIAVDPVRRYLFWTESFRLNTSLLAQVDIKISDLRGGNVHILALSVVGGGRTLGLDVTERRLYYMERPYVLAMCDYDNGNKVVTRAGLPPYAVITVSSKQLFWTTTEGEVTTIVKHAGELTFPVPPSLCQHCSAEEKESMFGPKTFLRVVDGRMQPIPDTDHHMYRECLHSKTSSDVCPCPLGYRAEHRTLHCLEEGFFLASFGPEIQAILLDGTTLPLLAKAHTNLTAVDFHFTKSLLFWYDSTESKIYRSPVLNPSQSQRRAVTLTVRGLSALAVDWTYDHVYWTSYDRDGGAVEACKLDGSGRQMIVPRDRANKWMSLALDPGDGTMYMADWLGGGVEVFGMDGTPMHRLAGRLSKPRSLTLVFHSGSKQIYWLETVARKTIIKACYLERRQECREVYKSPSVLPFSLAVLGTKIYWLERSVIYWLDTASPLRAKRRKSQLGSKLGEPTSLRLYHSQGRGPAAANYCNFRACRGLCVPLPREWGQTTTRCVTNRSRYRPPQRYSYSSMGL